MSFCYSFITPGLERRESQVHSSRFHRPCPLTRFSTTELPISVRPGSLSETQGPHGATSVSDRVLTGVLPGTPTPSVVLCPDVLS